MEVEGGDGATGHKVMQTSIRVKSGYASADHELNLGMERKCMELLSEHECKVYLNSFLSVCFVFVRPNSNLIK